MTPLSAPRLCTYPGCGVVTPTGRCAKHVRAEALEHDQRRGGSAERGYGGRWQKARATYLRHHPLCVACEAAGRLVAATVVDHITPHKGDQALFWDSDNNWQALCKRCHDRKTVREDGGWGR